jgi:hypothetical protein
LIPLPHFATPRGMTIARITQADRKTTQSGKAQAGKWLLEFERIEGQQPDPLTGWAGSGDTKTQVRLWFDTEVQAIAYAKKNGFGHHVVPANPVALKLQAYADNFR